MPTLADGSAATSLGFAETFTDSHGKRQTARRRSIANNSQYTQARSSTKWTSQYEKCIVGARTNEAILPSSFSRSGPRYPTVGPKSPMRLVYKKEAGGKGSQPQVVSDIRNELHILKVANRSVFTPDAFAKAFKSQKAAGSLFVPRLVLGSIAEDGIDILHLIAHIEVVPWAHTEDKMAVAMTKTRGAGGGS